MTIKLHPGYFDEKEDEAGAAGAGGGGGSETPTDQSTESQTGEEDGDQGAGGQEETALSAVESALGVSGGEGEGDGEQAGEGKDTGSEALDQPGASDEGAAGTGDGAEQPQGRKPEDGQQTDADTPADPFSEPIPEDLKPKTRERMEAMINGHNELREANTQLKERHEGLLNLMNETGANNEELAVSFDYLRLRHSENPEDLQAALQMAQQEVQSLSKALGVEVAGVDPLDDFPQLKQRVEDMELTREDALAIAKAEVSQRRYQQQTQAQTQATQQQQAYQQAVNSAAQQLSQLDQQLRQQDVNYAQKRALIDPHIESIIKSYPPNQWAAAFMQQWKLVSETAEALGQRPPPKRDEQPLGGTGGTGAGTRDPETMQEAVDAALGVSRRG